ncbi:MAG: hypothetical protein K0S21_2259, partial [Rhizobiaceae bacterium]|nr:hypothetical protein [Rhizobiaceae bacterium]
MGETLSADTAAQGKETAEAPLSMNEHTIPAVATGRRTSSRSRVAALLRRRAVAYGLLAVAVASAAFGGYGIYTNRPLNVPVVAVERNVPV